MSACMQALARRLTALLTTIQTDMEMMQCKSDGLCMLHYELYAVYKFKLQVLGIP